MWTLRQNTINAVSQQGNSLVFIPYVLPFHSYIPSTVFYLGCNLELRNHQIVHNKQAKKKHKSDCILKVTKSLALAFWYVGNYRNSETALIPFLLFPFHFSIYLLLFSIRNDHMRKSNSNFFFHSLCFSLTFCIEKKPSKVYFPLLKKEMVF